jgi:hypothetical protein
MLNAQQDTIRHLILSEVRLDRMDHAYLEITNVGDSALHLARFELGVIGPWSAPYPAGTIPWPGQPYANVDDAHRMMLPNVVLDAGKSYVIAAFQDYEEEQAAREIAQFGYAYDRNERITKKEMWKLADLQIHHPDRSGDATDSISEKYRVLEVWNGRDTWFLLYYLSNGDSVMIDQVNGIFDETDGTRQDGAMDVAGATDATNNDILMRKFTIKSGNTDFAEARGNDITESEWLPVPQVSGGNWEPNRAVFWTVGNHGDYNLDEATIKSNDLDINFTDTILTVPWGVRNDDSIMLHFNHVPGIAWHYHYAKNSEDSAYVSARTGDVLTLYACGNDLDKMDFKIVVTPPANGENRVVPKRTKDNDGFYTGGYVPFRVTEGNPGMDTIWNVAYATRVDTLLKYLEKAPDADWDIVWEDGNERTDLKLGDKLKVTAKNGSEKEYFLKVYKYRASRNANLTTITWPDIPEYYKGYFGWMGDTLPNFVSTLFDYNVQVPYDVVGIPALVAKPQQLNATLKVTRAKNLSGSLVDRTASFKVTAEDDTTILNYNVTFFKEVTPDEIQPWKGEPFWSQIVWQDQWANDFFEVCNPGTEPLDLSNYMLVCVQSADPATAIQRYSVDTLWGQRYGKYIPGYKWADEATWAVTPGRAVQDLATDSWVQPGDVFVLGDIQDGGHGSSGFPWFASRQCDIQLHYNGTAGEPLHNPWNEVVGSWNAFQRWTGYHYYIFKIKEEARDSIHGGLKAANDPNDFELIDHWGGATDGDPWTVGPEANQPQLQSYVRKPQYYLPDPTIPSESWGTTWDDCWWTMTNRAFYDAKNPPVPWPDDILFICEDLGKHFMNEVTVYKSTVASTTYLVDNGYKGDLDIRGVVTGTTVDGFVTNILKKDAGQSLTLKAVSNGNILTGTDVLANGDTLIVLSADSVNTTKYLLEVTDQGLSDNATLTSTTYTITVDGATGTVGGFDYGTTLATVVDNITVPSGASFTIIGANDEWIPLKIVNFDTMYVDVEVNDQIFFEVTSESGEVTILYQLKPNASASDAFVTSYVYHVDQAVRVIDFLPQGTNVGAFLRNLIPAPGATMQLIDKFGLERTDGVVVLDDKLVVTAQDGVTKAVYYLSMLAPEGKKSDYLAFVLSDVYKVDQLILDISSDKITGSTLVYTFLSNLIPAQGASVSVLDASGVAKSTGTMDLEDKLMVTAANGVTVVYYTIQLSSVSTQDLGNDMIRIYPNPSQGMVEISGLEAGNRIKVYNTLGALVLETPAMQSREVISLDNQSSGIYYIVISNSDSVIGRYKLIKQ